MNKIINIINTIKYLKWSQIYFRIYFYLKREIMIPNLKYNIIIKNKITLLENNIFFGNYKTKDKFIFLNMSKYFPEDIDWNYAENGKLWTYNLTYFDYLNQDNMTKEEGMRLINAFIEQSLSIKDGLEPFPISLRGINWIKFLSKYKIENRKYDNSLYAQYMILIDNLEYHLLGNHLLENGFSLLFGAYYFQDEKFYVKAKKILVEELDEQILQDGAHFELSPMYHQIMLFRILDCINLIKNNNWKDNELLSILIRKAEIMLGWLNTITYKSGAIPLLNDSANKIAPTTNELNIYANSLNIKRKNINLHESGYRKIKNKKYEMIIDVGNIGPDYILGHAHSDTFNFELYIKGEPFIVDMGLSTYEAGGRRSLERSTASHNTVQLEGIEQSEVWGAFRVASRAKIVHLIEKENYISASHDGYKKKLNAIHQREYIFSKDSIKLIDTIHSKNSYNAIARLHFHPEIYIEKKDNYFICNGVQIHSSSKEFEILEYLYASEFNKTMPAQVIEIKFNNKLEIEIQL